MRTISRCPSGETLRELAGIAGMRYSIFADIVADLEADRRVQRCEVTKPCGKGSRTWPGVRPV